MPFLPDNHKESAIPKGVTDFLPEQADRIGHIEGKICKIFELWGFRRIIPPMIEFEDVLAGAMGDDLRSSAFRFEDRQSGRLLVLPPDITPQVSRIEAMRMGGFPLPHRFYYNCRMLRHVESQSGRSRELFQAGVELIGLDSPEADAEMVAMAVEALQELGFEGFKLDLGQVDFFRGIIAASGLGSDTSLKLQQAVAKKDTSAVRELLENEKTADSVKEEIAALPRLFGGVELLERAASLVKNDRSRRAIDNLAAVVEILAIHGVRDQLTIDLGEIRGLAYHTGVTFEGFVPGLGQPVCGGGRYDGLMEQYGLATPATGFAFDTLALLQALEKSPVVKECSSRDLLVFNLKDDRLDALEIATFLRRKGYSVARDIIRRDFDQSLAYAARMNIREMMVIGENEGDDDELRLVTVADGLSSNISKRELLSGKLPYFKNRVI